MHFRVCHRTDLRVLCMLRRSCTWSPCLESFLHLPAVVAIVPFFLRSGVCCFRSQLLLRVVPGIKWARSGIRTNDILHIFHDIFVDRASFSDLCVVIRLRIVSHRGEWNFAAAWGLGLFHVLLHDAMHFSREA